MGYPEAQYTVDEVLQNVELLANTGIPIYDMELTIVSSGTGGGG